jgi:chromatin segregation and condensation protein Rec8/ScpA/Scc1 (kleisin family)
MGELSAEIEKEVNKIREDVLQGKISLLDLQLVPVFDKLKNSLDISTLDQSSKTYKETCQLLNKKFEELKKLLSSLDEEKQYIEYLKSNPDDNEILELFSHCWRKTFKLQALSYSFLKSSKERLDQPPSTPFSIEHLERGTISEDFVVDVSTHQFTEKMTHFYEKIKNELPCGFNEVFSGSQNQIEVYKRFIYILHLIQSKKIKYQPETNTLYE